MLADSKLKQSFNDKRLDKRFEKILDVLMEQPTASIPQAFKSPAATKAAYRFFNNDAVTAEKIRESSIQATIDHIKINSSGKIIIFPSDSTNIVLTSHKKLKGIGVLRNQKAKGLNLHTTVAATEENLLLGMIHQTCWSRKPEDYGQRALRRKKPIEEKESYRWIEAFHAAQNALPDDARGIFLGDRGADIYDLFLQSRKANMDLLVRSAHDRKVNDSSNKIFKEVEDSPLAGIMSVVIKRSGERKERMAHLEIRYKNLNLASPTHRNLPPININLIIAQEISNDPETQDLVHWKLLTTLSIESLEQAQFAVSTYAKRWLIERFHYTLKEGCQVEELQMEEAGRLDKAIATYSIVACRIMYITYLSRISPDESCSKVFDENEWKALYCYAKKTPHAPNSPPKLREAVMMLAQLGGFLCRKSDGEPGVKVIWRGMNILEGATEMYIILTRKLVGNA